MVVVVQDAGTGLLSGGGDQRVGQLDAVVLSALETELTKRADRSALHAAGVPGLTSAAARSSASASAGSLVTGIRTWEVGTALE